MATLAKWSVEDYHKMLAAGILNNRRVELIAGKIIEMSPEGPLHRYINVTVAKYLRNILAEFAEVYESHPITLNDSEPEPDIAIVKKPDNRYLERHPFPEDIYWLIEIGDTTLAYDLNYKSKIYANSKIPEYWVLDLKAKQLTVFRQPVRENYQQTIKLVSGIINPLPFPKIKVAIKNLFKY